MHYSVFIPGKFPSLNDYIQAERSNRYAGAKMKKEFTELVAKYFTKMPLVDEPVFVQFIWYEANTKRDFDNVAFSKKFVLDGMVKSGKLPNDNQKWITGFEDAFQISKDKPGVEVHVSW